MPPRKTAATTATPKTAATPKTTASKTAAAKKTTATTKAVKAPAATASAKATALKTTTAKKAPVVKKAPIKAAAPVAVKAITERFSKTDLLNHLTAATALTRKDVNAVLEELNNVIEGHIKKRGCGDFTIPGLLKIVTVKKPATKARKGINPFTGEETMFKAKPASVAVKIRPLKKLKEMAL